MATFRVSDWPNIKFTNWCSDTKIQERGKLSWLNVAEKQTLVTVWLAGFSNARNVDQLVVIMIAAQIVLISSEYVCGAVEESLIQ